MTLTKSDWYLILLSLVAMVMVVANELGLGVFAYAVLMYPAYWLMSKGFEVVKPAE